MIPGLRSYEVSASPVAARQGQATAADVMKFAQAGAPMLMFDTRAV